MTGTVAPPGYEETPVFFPAGSNTLFGILTHPTGPARDVAVTLLTGGGFMTMVEKGGWFVPLARRLAGEGYHCFRFDYHGTGESTGTVARFLLSDTFEQDVRAAMAWVESREIRRHVLVGSCFGARAALAPAPSIRGLEGLVLLTPPVRDERPHKQNLAKPDADRSLLRAANRLPFLRPLLGSYRVRQVVRWLFSRVYGLQDGVERIRSRQGSGDASASFVRPLRRLIHRGVPILILFGDEDTQYADFQRAMQGSLGRLLDGAGPLVTVRVVPGSMHGFEQPEVQRATSEIVVEWSTRDEPTAATRMARSG